MHKSRYCTAADEEIADRTFRVRLNKAAERIEIEKKKNETRQKYLISKVKKGGPEESRQAQKKLQEEFDLTILTPEEIKSYTRQRHAKLECILDFAENSLDFFEKQYLLRHGKLPPEKVKEISQFRKDVLDLRNKP